MKIYIKKGKKSYGIRLPLSAVKLIPAGVINHAACRTESPAADVDFKKLKKAIHLLKEYKGLNVIEVKNDKGEEVIVQI